jgi:hypothetical protein
MPKVKVTNSKGLVQESGTGVEIKSQVQKITNFYPNGTSAKTADFSAEAGYVYLITKADGCAVTLPTPGPGDRIKLVNMARVTSNNHVITSPSGYLLSGFVVLVDQVDGTNDKNLGFAPDGSNDRVITLSGTTKGGLGGDVIELVGIADGGTPGWYVEGHLIGSGNVVTPFS